MTAEEHPGSHRHGEPFVGVARDGVRGLDSGEITPEARRDDGRAAPRRIDVKPQTLRLAKTSQIWQGINHASCGCPAGADHHEWREPAFPVLSHTSCKIPKIHLQMAVHGYRPQRPP